MATFAVMAVSSAIPAALNRNATFVHATAPLSYLCFWVIPFGLLGLVVLASRQLAGRMLAGVDDVVRQTSFVAYDEATIDELYYLAREHASREVGPGKHFLGCAHTQDNFETDFYRSPNTDNNSFEQWEAEGGVDLSVRANALWKKQLAEYEAPPIDPAADEAVLDYVSRRKASFADSNV